MSCTRSENLKCPCLYFAEAWIFCGDSSGRWNRKKPQPPCLVFSTGIELGLKFPPRAGKHRYDFRNPPSLEQSQPGAKEKGNFLTCFYQLCQQRTMTVQYTSPRVCLGPADSFTPFHSKREKENSKGETRGAGLGESAFIQSLQCCFSWGGCHSWANPCPPSPISCLFNIWWKTSASEVPQSNTGRIFLDVLGAANIFKGFSIL